MQVLRRRGWLLHPGLVFSIALSAAASSPFGAARTAAQQAPPPEQRAGVPGSVTLPPYGIVDFSIFYAYSQQPMPFGPPTRPGLPSEVLVTNLSVTTATVSADLAADGFTVTVAIPSGFAISRVQRAGQPAVEPCTSPGYSQMTCHATAIPSNAAGAEVLFTVFDELPVRPAVQTARLGAGDDATFLMGRTPNARVEVVERHAGLPGRDVSNAAEVSWDGQNVHISAPAGVAVVPDGNPLLCTPATGIPNDVTCPATGSPPRLLSFSLDDRRQPGAIQALAPPGSVVLAPEGYGVLVWPAADGSSSGSFGGVREIFVHNRSDQNATIAADNTTLTITVSQGYIPVPDAPCTPAADVGVSICPLTGASFITFDAADAAHPQPLPQQVSVGAGHSVALSAAGASGIAAVAVAYDANGFGSQAAPALDVAWDGAGVVISAPSGYEIAFAPGTPYGDQGCTPNDEVPTAVTCPASGQPPRLFHVGARSLSPDFFPPATPRGLFATIINPSTADEQAVGRPVMFAAQGRPDIAYVWDFGDGSIEVGQVVQHSYAAAGLYTVGLTVIQPEFLGQTTITQLVSVGEAPVSVTYPAGWNLIGVPRGTTLTGVLGPLYTTNFCPNVPAPPGAEPQPCSPGYKTVPADQAQVIGDGYWAYFPQPTTIALPFVDDQLGGVSYQPGTWFMAGNPTFKPAMVHGADAVMVYDPVVGSYRQTDTLQPGQGAWVYSASGATVSIYANPPPPALCTASPPQPSPAWYQRCPSSSPSPRFEARVSYDPAQDNVVLFGGSNYEQNTTFGDTWLWDGTSWMQAHPAVSPSPRTWPAMAYDDALGKVILFGGAGPGSFDDTWSWDGTTWSEQQPAASPPPRYNAALAYDAAHRVLVLFGGFGEGGVRGGYLADTWTYDGTTWTPVCGTDGTPVCGPPPGLGIAMAYDPLRQQIVMFGGSNGDNYTWTWDGSGLTLQQPATAPPAPQFGTLVFDPRLDGMVFVGAAPAGFGASGQQLWLWDGANWMQLHPPTAPPARHDLAIAQDPAGGVVMFGGGQFANGVERNLDDTWVLR
jgi:PKD repeat protein